MCCSWCGRRCRVFAAYYVLCQVDILRLLPCCTFVNCGGRPACSTVPTANTTRLKVILPSVGQTGTTSIAQALRLMGYRVFHTEEKTVYAHVTMKDNTTPTDFAQAIARCNLEVIALEPTTDSFPHMLATSPDAKVIITWRDYPSWYTSTMTGGFSKDVAWAIFNMVSFRGLTVLPWLEWSDDLFGGLKLVAREGRTFSGRGEATLMTYLLRVVFASKLYSHQTNVYERGTFKVNASEEAYLAHIDEIRQLTPPEQLLEFEVKRHGWAELEQFTGRKRPAGRDIPRARTKASYTNDAIFDHNLAVGLSALAIGFLAHSVNLAIVSALIRMLGFLCSKWACCARAKGSKGAKGS
mmetsp:Transcript_19737/g.57264  ORF Transcript_19737/g.57264 Transcript_19737/m.57264 type:complete len:353 (+) Transcript_19737:94-1152(+)